MSIPIRFLERRLERRPCDCGEAATTPHETERALYFDRAGARVDAPQVGDAFFVLWHEPNAADGCPWTNCDGAHLFVIVPGDHWWNVDGRCSNCTMPHDRTHRCWVRHGSPADGSLHVDKSGPTCQAGAGSILTDSWHGFLHNGALVQC